MYYFGPGFRCVLLRLCKLRSEANSALRAKEPVAGPAVFMSEESEEEVYGETGSVGLVEGSIGDAVT